MSALNQAEVFLPGIEEAPVRISDRVRRFTREEYHQAAEVGVIGPGERLELIRGEILKKMPQLPPHPTTIGIAADTLQAAFGPGYHVRQQSPLALAEESEPEPDLLVVGGRRADFASRHPTPADVELLVEVSDTTLRFDRRIKGSLYAEAGIADYWIVNVNARCVEVYRDPQPSPSAEFPFAYASTAFFWEEDLVAPLARPEVLIPIADLLPPTPSTAAPEPGI